MQKLIAGHIDDPERRKQFVEDNCDKIEEKSYMKPFTPELMSSKKDELSEVVIALSELESEKQSLMSQMKIKMKPLIDRHSVLLSEIKQKAEYTKEDCYKYVDHEAKEVGYYNAEGQLVESRPIRPDEMQKTIFNITSKTGTNE